MPVVGKDSLIICQFRQKPEPLDAVVAYALLGVSSSPRLDDVFKEINRLGREPRTEAATRRIESILGYLSKWLEQGNSATQLTAPRTMPWLPARGKVDRWYRPAELYASYQKDLFESQALFLDIPIELQQSASQLLRVLGLNLAPSVDLVVKHLRQCAAHGIPVHNAIYRFLNDKAGDLVINSLRNSKCLWLDAAYKLPEEVFWTEHRFGKYRWRLTEDLRSYHKLLSQLEVKESPDADDALSVLKEISTEFARTNRPLDGDTRAVLMACWQLLEEALQKAPTLAAKLNELRSVKCVPNEALILNPPEWMFFENRAGLAQKFEGFLSKNVIARPLGAAHALQTAGVRPLGSAVEVELLECDDPVDDPYMTERLYRRREEIGRVLESQSSGPKTMAALAQLENIKCRVAAALVLRFRLRAFNRELASQPEDVPALYDAQQRTLLYCNSDGHVPWSAIARELSIALFPDEDPGRFAPGLKEALAPESAVEAGKTLDELGFARLDATIQETPQAAQAVGQLGTEPTSSGEEFQPIDLTMGTLSPEEAVKQILGPNAPPPTPGISDPTLGVQGSHRGTPPKGTSTTKGRPVLRSYIPSPNGTPHESPESQGTQGRSPVDVAGVSRVMEYERSAARQPTEMPSNNKGYDIESRDATGALLRYIEVKSFSGDWDSTYADLSHDQFEKANHEREKFWLYVVERAQKEDYHIHRIQNPAGKANHFMFDDGWRATAECDAEQPSESAVRNPEVPSD